MTFVLFLFVGCIFLRSSHGLIHIIDPTWPGPRKKYNPQGVVFFPRTGHLGSIHIILVDPETNGQLIKRATFLHNTKVSKSMRTN